MATEDKRSRAIRKLKEAGAQEPISEQLIQRLIDAGQEDVARMLGSIRAMANTNQGDTTMQTLTNYPQSNVPSPSADPAAVAADLSAYMSDEKPGALARAMAVVRAGKTVAQHVRDLQAASSGLLPTSQQLEEYIARRERPALTKAQSDAVAAMTAGGNEFRFRGV